MSTPTSLRRALSTGAVAAALAFALAPGADAQAAATVTVSPNTGAPGSTFTITMNNYTACDPNDPNSRWINPAAFAAAPLYSLGTAAFYQNGFRNPMFLDERISIVKRTTLLANEKNPVVLTYRADAFNLLNAVCFSAPALNRFCSAWCNCWSASSRVAPSAHITSGRPVVTR